MKREDHIEVSEGPTKIVASKSCPLTDKDVLENQVFTDYVVCICQGQGNDFTCPSFYGAVFPNKEGLLFVDCRR